MKDEIKECLKQVIELRIHQIHQEIESEKEQSYQQEMKAQVEQMDKIFQMLPEAERRWLDNRLITQAVCSAQERERYYKAGLADAIELLSFLKK